MLLPAKYISLPAKYNKNEFFTSKIQFSSYIVTYNLLITLILQMFKGDGRIESVDILTLRCLVIQLATVVPSVVRVQLWGPEGDFLFCFKL
jgi:hypothetical protein